MRRGQACDDYARLSGAEADGISVADTGGDRLTCCKPRARKSPSRSNSTISSTGFPAGFGPGGWGYLAYAIGIAFAVFQLYVAAFNYLPSQVVRGIHVGFLLLMTFGLIGNFTARSDFGRALGWLIGGARLPAAGSISGSSTPI